MILEHCGRASCVQIIEGLQKQVAALKKEERERIIKELQQVSQDCGCAAIVRGMK
jgi:hypothetical protein